MIASRKLDRLSTSAKLLQSQIKPGSPAELDHLQCNIRNEEQVQLIHQSFVAKESQAPGEGRKASWFSPFINKTHSCTLVVAIANL